MHTPKDNMSEIDRLKKRSDFVLARDDGKSWVSHGMILQVRDNDDHKKRIGVTVTKKVSTSAVKRNRIKRRLRAVSVDVLSTTGRNNADYVLIGRKATLDRDYKSLKKDLLWCLDKMGLKS